MVHGEHVRSFDHGPCDPHEWSGSMEWTWQYLLGNLPVLKQCYQWIKYSTKKIGKNEELNGLMNPALSPRVPGRFWTRHDMLSSYWFNEPKICAIFQNRWPEDEKYLKYQANKPKSTPTLICLIQCLEVCYIYILQLQTFIAYYNVYGTPC